MKSRIFKIIVISWIFCILLYIPLVYGNPVGVYSFTNSEGIAFTIGLLINLLIFTILIELGILYIYYRTYIIEGRCSLKFIKVVVVVNLFTFPMTQIIGLLLSTWLIRLSLSLPIVLLLLNTEIFPISIEYVLYLKIFDEFHASNDFITPVPKNKIISSTIIANSITFSLGILVFLPQILSKAFL